MARTATASKRSTGSGRKTGAKKTSSGGTARKRTTSRAGGSTGSARKKTTARKTGTKSRKTTASSTRSKRSTSRSTSRKTTARSSSSKRTGSSTRGTGSSRSKSTASKTTQRRGSGTATGRTRKDALSILEKDHRTVEQLFERYMSAAKARKLELCRQICMELTIHADLEEQHLYPEANRRITGKKDIVEEAYEEHDEAKQLIERLETMDAGPEMDSLMQQLMESVMHHVQEEEGEMFPQIREHFEAKELTSIGRQMEQMKNQLQQQDEMAGV